MNFLNLIMAGVIALMVLVVFLPLANAFMGEMTGLFSAATFMALNALILVVVFVGMFGILEQINPDYNTTGGEQR